MHRIHNSGFAAEWDVGCVMQLIEVSNKCVNVFLKICRPSVISYKHDLNTPKTGVHNTNEIRCVHKDDDI